MRSWFEMKKTADADSAEVYIYGEVGKSFWDDDSVGAKQFVDDLAALGDVNSILLRVNSPGGSVFDAVAIHNALKNHKAIVTARVDGIAASAASFVVMAADKITMPSNSFMLLHGASGFAMGTADDIRALADDLDRIDTSLTATYASRAKTTQAKVKALMKEDRLMDAGEAKALGFADEVTEPVKMAATFSLRLLPKAAAERFQAEAGEPPKPKPEPQPEPEPEPEPDDEPAATAELITLTKQSGAAEHKAYVDSVTDLCVLAGEPGRVGAYVRASTPAEQVRKELLALRAAEQPIVAQHPLADGTKSAATMWDKVTDKINARSRKGVRP